MSCGCKNCNGTVSMTSQLPPGCDSILNITTDTVGSEIVVTITFCSGGTQQFSIPIPSNGQPGPGGSTGEPGQDGVNVIDVESSVANNVVTLTFILSNGTTLVETFAIDASPSAYMVDHRGLDVPQENNLVVTLSGAKQALATSVLPAGIFSNNDDTVYFDIVINLDYSSQLINDKPGEPLFNELTFEFNSSISPSTSGVNLNLNAGGTSWCVFPTLAMKFSGSITRRSSASPLGFLQNSFDVILQADQFRAKDASVDNYLTPNGGLPLGDLSTMAWNFKNENIDINAENLIKITATAGDYTTDTVSYTVTSTQVYFTTRYIPKL